ncbi:hypothetical protein DPMN_124052 [Dreissena polymorpha]|uniref:Uncharacterized protein n=1 Tax=Dreissena polymorpha TaxID=45954 RepID=A0A9D4JVW8_DREPO|nr:hypothetical protein DPMN_124051 [Dreissena polymorpha]KAH3822278.1 hypothetical protein DPMN_124052 [Dreissena polymorpha]
MVTFSSFSPFMVVSALVLFALFTIVFDFSALTDIPYAPAIRVSADEVWEFAADVNHDIIFISESHS